MNLNICPTNKNLFIKSVTIPSEDNNFSTEEIMCFLIVFISTVLIGLRLFQCLFRRKEDDISDEFLKKQLSIYDISLYDKARKEIKTPFLDKFGIDIIKIALDNPISDLNKEEIETSDKYFKEKINTENKKAFFKKLGDLYAGKKGITKKDFTNKKIHDFLSGIYKNRGKNRKTWHNYYRLVYLIYYILIKKNLFSFNELFDQLKNFPNGKKPSIKNGIYSVNMLMLFKINHKENDRKEKFYNKINKLELEDKKFLKERLGYTYPGSIMEPTDYIIECIKNGLYGKQCIPQIITMKKITQKKPPFSRKDLFDIGIKLKDRFRVEDIKKEIKADYFKHIIFEACNWDEQQRNNRCIDKETSAFISEIPLYLYDCLLLKLENDNYYFKK
ncbi:hypothetical protein ACFL2K_05170 [Candidatus Margulisiibacteriota bacterium]